MKREITNIDTKKATTISWYTSQEFQMRLWYNSIFNQNIKNWTFFNELKNAGRYPVYMKKNCQDKSNYRPVSILPLLWQPFERSLYKQINRFRTKLGFFYSLTSTYQWLFLKDQFWVLCFLKFTCAIFFCEIVDPTSYNTRTVLPFMLVNQIWTFYLHYFKRTI